MSHFPNHIKTAICIFLNRVFNPASISTKSVLLYFCNLSNFVNVFTPSLRIYFIHNYIYTMKENKELYVIPAISIVEFKQEGVICASGEVTSTMDGIFLEETI